MAGLPHDDLINSICDKYGIPFTELCDALNKILPIDEDIISIEEALDICGKIWEILPQSGKSIGRVLGSIIKNLYKINMIKYLRRFGINPRERFTKFRVIDVLREIRAKSHEIPLENKNFIYQKLSGEKNVILIRLLLKNV